MKIFTVYTRSLAPWIAVTAVIGGCPKDPSPLAETDLMKCFDRLDNDGDQLVDCDDDDCRPYCPRRDAGPGSADSGRPAPAPDAAPDSAGSPDAAPDAAGDGGDGGGDGGRVEYIHCDDGVCADPMLTCYEFYPEGRPVSGPICAPRGRYCLSDDECPEGVACAPLAGWAGLGKFCHVPSSSCTSHLDCPDGFHCEGRGRERSCVDRRFGCFNNRSCPSWYRCVLSASLAHICQSRGSETCTSEVDCTGDQICIDIDGDGTKECQYPNGECTTNADCDHRVCGGGLDNERGASCGVVGRCANAADCPAGYVCVDVNADGVKECQQTTGSCRYDADCPPRQLCRPQAPDGVPHCVSE